MESAITLCFDIIPGKKLPKEYQEACAAGYLEVYRTAITGGHTITMARQTTALVNGKRKCLFVLDKMPPKELLIMETMVTSMTSAKEGKPVEGHYGNCGRMFFVPGSADKPATRTKHLREK